MGGRDIRHRETKKQKKDAKKVVVTEIIQPTADVEVIRKKRKEKEEEES